MQASLATKGNIMEPLTAKAMIFQSNLWHTSFSKVRTLLYPEIPLHEGIDRNTREGRDIIPLAYAVDIGNPRIVDLLLENWAHLDLADNIQVTLSP
jgi:hypothetical protein